MRNENFIAFILTHGRADRVITHRTLRRCGYTGRIVVVVDNEDKTIAEYRKQYGDEVYVFDKKAIADKCDEGDNFNDRRAIIYARNACFEIATELGADYFIELDDDYTEFRFKSDAQHNYCDKGIKNLDRVLDMMIDFLEVSGACTVAMAQGGDFIGGGNSTRAQTLKPWRKAMNTFVCSTKRPFKFFGRINEDVNFYSCAGRRGALMFTLPSLDIKQMQTQSNSGGMTDLYLDSGTYVKSFYSIMYAPSCVKINEMCSKHKRLHHSVTWKNAVPCIVDESIRKIPRER